MKNITKIALVVAGVGAVAGVAYVTKKETEKAKKAHYTQIMGEPEEEKEETFKDKVKAKATEKVAEVVLFVADHKEEIETVSTIVGVAGAVIGVVNGIKEFKQTDEMMDKVNYIYDHSLEFEKIWNKHTTNTYEFMDGVQDSLQTVIDATKKKK